MPLLDVVRVKPGQGLVKVFDIEIHISPCTSLLFSVIIDITNSPYLSSSSSPMLLTSSISPCILCQPAHLVLGELHYLRLPPLLVLLPVLLVHHHLELEISRELLNLLSLKKLCPERSHASSQTNLADFERSVSFKTLVVLVKGIGNHWNKQKWKELQGSSCIESNC